MRHKYSVARYSPGKNYSKAKHYSFYFKFPALIVLHFFKLIDLFRETHVNAINGYKWKNYSAYMYYIPLYNVSNHELGTEFADAGPWRSYQLDASGDNLSELLESASISEIDQDGGDLDNYGIDNGGACDDAIEYLEALTGEHYEDTEYCKNRAAEAAMQRAERETETAIRKAIPCAWCEGPKGEDWWYMGELCRDCHSLHLDDINTHCTNCSIPIDNKGYQRRCEDCNKAAMEHVSECYVCGLDKPAAQEYFLKLPDCGPGGSDIEEFCCKDCATNPIDAWSKRARRRTG